MTQSPGFTWGAIQAMLQIGVHHTQLDLLNRQEPGRRAADHAFDNRSAHR